MPVLSRRDLLRAFSAALAAAALPACKRAADDAEPDDAEPDDSDVIDVPGPGWEDVLRDLQARLRASPDHRTSRAARLVSAGDPGALLAFVRDTIAWHPSGERNPYSTFGLSGDPRRGGYGQKYGARGALRAGGGSALDKALLLRDLLATAGFPDAEVVAVPSGALRNDDRADLFLRAWDRPEPAVDVPEDVLAQWSVALGFDPRDAPAPVLDPVDPDGAAAAALAARLLAALPDGASGRATDVQWSRLSGDLPMVRFTDADGAARLANPHHSDATLDDPALTDTVLPADRAPFDLDAAPGPYELTLRLRARTTDRPDWRDATLLAEATWPVSELMGRQVLIGTRPVARTLDLFTAPARQHTAFQPYLAVQSVHGDEVPEPVVGDVITLGADRVSVDDEDRVRANGAVVDDPAAPRVDPARVASLRLEVDGSAFPRLFARAWPKDADGASLDGLRADQLGLTDAGAPTIANLSSNTATPQIILLRDTSLSMPGVYRGEAGAQLLSDLADAIRARFPGAVITTEDTGSNLWTRLAAASTEGPNVVVYLTDGDINDSATPAIEAALRAGPPCLLVSVEGTPRQALFDMADLSAGEVLTVDAPDALEDAVLDALDALDLPPLLLSWWALPVDGAPDPREVTLTIGGATASATYTPVALRGARRLIALELEVSMVGAPTTTRCLAGWSGDGELPDDPATLDRLAEEVHLALLGTRMLSVEGDDVSPSMALDDLIATRLGLVPFLRAGELGVDDAVALMETGFPAIPEALLGAWGPLPGAHTSDQAVVPVGPRLALVSLRGTPDDVQTSTLDLLPTTVYRGATRGGAAADNFTATLTATAHLALLEASLGDGSTLSLLPSDTSLETANDRPFRFSDLSEDEEIAWQGAVRGLTNHILVPSAGAPRAGFWVHDTTGTVVAFLPGGEGGSQRILDIMAVLDAAIALVSHTQGLGPGLAVASAYGITLVKLYTAVAVTLEGFVTEGLDDKVRCALERFTCDALAAVAFPPLLGALNGLAGAAFGAGLCDLVSKAGGCD